MTAFLYQRSLIMRGSAVTRAARSGSTVCRKSGSKEPLAPPADRVRRGAPDPDRQGQARRRGVLGRRQPSACLLGGQRAGDPAQEVPDYETGEGRHERVAIPHLCSILERACRDSGRPKPSLSDGMLTGLTKRFRIKAALTM